MNDALFRREVIDAKRGNWLGSITLATPVSRWLIVLFALVVTTALLALVCLASYTRRETVSGQLVPSAGLLNVNSPGAGVVVRLLVHENQLVRKNQPLLELGSEQYSVSLGDMHGRIGEQLAAQQRGLEKDLENHHKLVARQASALKEKIDLLAAQISEMAGQMALESQQVKSNEALLERILPLAKKSYVSAVQIQQQRTAVLDAQSQYKNLARQQLDIRQQLEAARQQLEQLPWEAASRRNEIERQLASVAKSIAENEAARAIVLRAPRDGVVSALLAKEGQTAMAGQPLLSLIPAGSTLQAQLLVPSRDVGFVVPGSPVVLRYQAYPYQKFGQQHGRVISVSRSALSPAEVQALMGQQAREPLYKVGVALDRSETFSASMIKPGMAVDADILMERRRLAEWMFDPLNGIRQRIGGQTRG